MVVAGRVKTMNESIYYNVDRLHDAIAATARSPSCYFDWDLHGERRYRPGKYTASPYAFSGRMKIIISSPSLRATVSRTTASTR